MGVSSRGRWGAAVAALSMVCSLAVAPSAWAGSPSASSGVASSGVSVSPSSGVPAPGSGSLSAGSLSVGSPSASGGAGGSSQWPAGVPDPSSWLRNVKVSDVGAHTADVSFDWDLSYLLNGKQSGKTTQTTKSTHGSEVTEEHDWSVFYGTPGGNSDASVDPAKDIDGVCFSIVVGRATSVTPTGESYGRAWGDQFPFISMCGGLEAGAVNNSEMTPEDYQRIFGTKTEDWDDVAGALTYQSWWDRDNPQPLAKSGVWKGHYDTALIGLDANTLYGNSKDPESTNRRWDWPLWSFDNAVDSVAADLYKKGVRKTTKVDVRRLKVGVTLHLKDSSKAVQQCKTDKNVDDKTYCNTTIPYIYDSSVSCSGAACGESYDGYFVTAAVPDFRTGVEPGVVSSVSKLPASAKGRISVDASAVKQGSVARFYVAGLKKDARGKADANSLFWYAYVYSSPQRMTGPDGSPYVMVKKDSAGRYYFDAIVPAGLEAGSHTVSLVDAAGACQGWAPVTVTASDTVTMWRLYNPNSGEHFYTGNTAERDHLVHVGWKSEGTGWTAPVKGDPVYRLYNPNAGDHHYTLNPAERDMLVRAGWKSEGIGWYSAAASVTGRKPLYRQYNPNARAGAHNYTLSRAENDHLVRVGWRAEGLAWYAVS